MSRCESKVKCHLVNLRHWQSDMITLVYWNDKIYGADGCKTITEYGEKCRKSVWRVCGRNGCKWRMGLCLDHYRSLDGCTCDPPDESHASFSVNLRTQYEHQIQIKLPISTKSTQEDLPSKSGLPSPQPATPSASHSLSTKIKKKKSKKDDKELEGKIGALQKEIEELRPQKNEVDEAIRNL